MKPCLFRVRHVAAMNEDQASACFFSLLDYLEGQRKRSVQENNMLQGPDFAGMRAYLLVRSVILQPLPVHRHVAMA